MKEFKTESLLLMDTVCKLFQRTMGLTRDFFPPNNPR